MIVRLLVAVMLCHHIEGQCAPPSAATVAAQAAAAAAKAQVEALAALARAERRVQRVSAVEAARAARTPESPAQRRYERSLAAGRRRQAIEAVPVVVDGLVVDVEPERRAVR
jgi:hypothetical protein